MEHVERAGVHSGDSISVYPSQNLSERLKNTMVEYTARLAKELNIVGLMNIQYVIYNDEVYIIEVNPRSSRTVPYLSKVTGVPMVDLATKCMLGEKLKDLGYGTGLYPEKDYVAVKVPVFSFEKLHDVDTQLGPEMKSTGEVLGIAKTFEDAIYKGLVAAGYRLKHEGGVLITVRDSDKHDIIPIADKLQQLGFTLYATGGTALRLNKNMTLIESGKIDYVIATSKKGRIPQYDSVKIRRKVVERAIPCLTSLDTAKVLTECLAMEKSIYEVDLVDITKI